jgi:hypothetical protein
MGKNDIDALLDFYLFSDLEDEEAVDEYLEQKSLDFNSFYEDLGAKLKKKKAELKIAEGKKFKEEYLKKIKQLLIESKAAGRREEELNYAFRKLENLNIDELKNLANDEEKLEIIKKLLDD